MKTAERNRAIKKTLELAFGRGKVRVRSDRGWVNINIDWTPRDMEQRREMETEVERLLAAAGHMKEIGTYGYDDPGSDYGYGNNLSLNFNTPRFYLTQRCSDGSLHAKADHWSDWQQVEG